MDLFTSCLGPLIFNIRVTTTTMNTINSENEAEPALTADSFFFGQSILFPLILLAFLLIFFILLLMLYCIQRKGSQKKKFLKGKKLHADYLSKGIFLLCQILFILLKSFHLRIKFSKIFLRFASCYFSRRSATWRR